MCIQFRKTVKHAQDADLYIVLGSSFDMYMNSMIEELERAKPSLRNYYDTYIQAYLVNLLAFFFFI